MDKTPAIRCRGLIKDYGALRAVNGLDLEIHAGECFGLLGPNGAGKTTTVEILEGLLPATAGEVELLGRTWATDADWLRQRLGISLQETNLPDKLTVEETLRLFRSFYGAGPDVKDLLELVSLTDKRRTWYSKLSGGQKQRLAVACALVGDPEMLFLDEPTSGLDPQSRRQLWGLIERFKAGEGHSPKDFVIYTSVADPGQLARAKKLGYKFFSKPTDLETLVEVLKKICVRHKLLRKKS